MLIPFCPLPDRMLPYGDMAHSRRYTGEMRFGPRWSKFKSQDLMLISYVSVSNSSNLYDCQFPQESKIILVLYHFLELLRDPSKKMHEML